MRIDRLIRNRKKSHRSSGAYIATINEDGTVHVSRSRERYTLENEDQLQQFITGFGLDEGEGIGIIVLQPQGKQPAEL